MTYFILLKRIIFNSKLTCSEKALHSKSEKLTCSESEKNNNFEFSRIKYFALIVHVFVCTNQNKKNKHNLERNLKEKMRINLIGNHCRRLCPALLYWTVLVCFLARRGLLPEDSLFFAIAIAPTTLLD